MDRHVKDFFCQFSDETPHGTFHKVLALHDAPDGDFAKLATSLLPQVRGWLELAQLPLADRIELTREFWLCKMRAYPRLNQFLLNFFDTIEDIGIFVTQRRFDEELQCHMVYSLPDDGGYFRGLAPATEEQVLDIQNYFSDWVLPDDYLAFLQIHNGFAKTTDCTGLIPTTKLISNYEYFQQLLEQHERSIIAKGVPLNPKLLLPFYESFGMPFYQCFWGEWHPEGEMGNVYYSGVTHSITEPVGVSGEADNMAFSTFADWLIFYLERID
jgi:hypothetical protein